MKRKINLPISYTQRNAAEIMINVQISCDSLAAWCMELMFVEKELAEFLIVVDPSTDTKLEIQIDSNISQNRRGTFTRNAKNLSLTVTPTELEYWAHFFLKYHCYGRADVNHLDVDLHSETSGDLFLVWEVDNFAEPLTEAEARKRLQLQ